MNMPGSRPGEEPRPGIVAVVTPHGDTREVADNLWFPNGMAVTPDGSTLIIAESHAHRLTAFTITAAGSLTDRRVWAELDQTLRPTASASMPKARSGMPTSPTGTVVAWPKAAR